MVFLYNFIVFVSFTLLCAECTMQGAKKKKKETVEQVSTAEVPKEVPSHKNQFSVRVLLDEKEHAALSSEPWKLTSKQGFFVTDPNEKNKKTKTDVQKLAISIKNGQLLINNKKVGTQVLLAPQGETISLNDNRYRGSLLIIVDGATVKLINCINMEEYVACVLMTESWPGWPLEVNKVFAIACRTYVIAMVKAAKTSKQLYHVKNTNKHQTYRGEHDTQIFKDAVEQTKGLFLTYNNKPITAMYDACCGGVIPAHMHGVNFKDSPYLARKNACTFCSDAKVFSWEIDYHIDALTSIIQKEVPSIKRVKDCRVTKKDRAGIVKEVTLKGHTHVSLTGKKVYSIVKGVKSFCFNAHKSGSTITFKGHGLGHHMGLCQWGTKGMVDQGYEYPEILEFYYPGTALMRIV